MPLNARRRSRSKRIKSFKARSKAASTARKPRHWWKQNWGTVCSLLLASTSLAVSTQALLNSQASERLERSEKSQSAKAVATLFRGRASEMEVESVILRMNLNILNFELWANAEDWHKDFRFLRQLKLPQFSPTTEEIKVLAQTGDDTAGQLSLCVEWRDKVQEDIDDLFVVRGLGGSSTADPESPVSKKLLTDQDIKWLPTVMTDASKLQIACEKANSLLEHFSIAVPTAN